ncbi:MAG: glycosyltransferase family 4 protein [Acidimicrobiia bacterium]
MTRIAYVCADPGVPVFGNKGASVHVQELTRALIGFGAEVEIFTPRLGGMPPAGLEGVRVHRLPEIAPADQALRERLALAVNGALKAALEDQGPFDLVYERYSLWSWVGMVWARHRQIPGLLEVNAPLIEEQTQHRRLVDRRAAERVATTVFQAAGVILAVSRGVADWVQRWPGIADRTHVVPNGVDPDRFHPDGRRPGEAFTIGFVGTLKPWHGTDTLVQAFGRLARWDPTVRLLLVGDGPERRRLEEELDRMGLSERATFAGGVPPSEVPAWLSRMDLAVAPYPSLPGFYFSPLKLFEYLAAGLPVVASRVGQVAEVIVDGENGLLCQPGDPAALAAAIAGLRVSPARRAAMGEAGRRSVVGAHTWRAVAGRVLQLAASRAGTERRA